MLAELDPDAAGIGGKARSLARLRAAGLPTPDGFVLTDDLFRALLGGAPIPAQLDGPGLRALDEAARRIDEAPWPKDVLAALEARARSLDAPLLSVRSSFAAEDDAAALAPGVFESRIAVPPGELVTAVRQVLRSALAPGAVAYALGRGHVPGAPPVAVLIHGYVAGDAAGAAAVDPARGPLVTCRQGAPSSTARAAITGALASLARQHGAVEVEWVASGDEVVFVQLRPYRAPPAAAPWPGFSELPASERAEEWRWDAAHNPLPLSPAQSGLVALVDGRCRTGLRQRTLGGYLFYASGGSSPREVIAPAEAPVRLEALRASTLERLARMGEAPTVEESLALFTEVYEPLFGVIGPAARRGRGLLEEFLRKNAPLALPALPVLLAGVPSMASARREHALHIARAPTADERAAALDAYLALFGDEAPVWDVAVPTRREDPASLRDLIAPLSPAPESLWQQEARRVRESLPRMARLAWKSLLPAARACVAVGEDDDWLYARVQAAVRRALLAQGRRLAATGVVDSPDDVFYWPLERAREAVAVTAAKARAMTVAGREAVAAARRDPPPRAAGGAGLLRGAATSGRAIGRVFPHRPGAPAGPPDAVLVAETLLPTELPLLTAAAFVVETGGPLDHVAAQARERGVPAVVGVAGATAALREGDLVLVDGDHGVVARLGPAP